MRYHRGKHRHDTDAAQSEHEADYDAYGCLAHGEYIAGRWLCFEIVGLPNQEPDGMRWQDRHPCIRRNQRCERFLSSEGYVPSGASLGVLGDDVRVLLLFAMPAWARRAGRTRPIGSSSTEKWCDSLSKAKNG